MYLAFDINYINDQEFKELQLKVNEVSKLISGLLKYLHSTL